VNVRVLDAWRRRTTGLLSLAAAALAVPLAATPAIAATAVPAAAPAVTGWRAFRLPLPAGAFLNSFQPAAISCYSATVCAGGGTYADIRGHHAALLRWSAGTKWSAGPAPLPAGASQDPRATVASMSCPAATRCFAGGNYSSGDNYGMLLTGSPAHWSARKAPLPANATLNPDATVAGMSCPSVTWCTAVGQYSDADGNQYALLLRLAGGTWTAAAAPVRAPAGEHLVASLDAVSCPSATRCFAGGWRYDSSLKPAPLMLTWHAGKWIAVKAALPAGAAAEPNASITAISCPATTQCVAVGGYVDGRGNQQGFVLTWSGTSWTARRAPLPADAGINPWTELDAVSCPAASRCTAGGGYENAASQPLGLLLTWSGGRWTATHAPAAAYQLTGITCPTLTKCVAVSLGIGHPVLVVGP
jgi:hypothetical protein